MSPMSVSAALVEISTLTATCGNRLRAIIDVWKYASVPSEILALSNEVSDLRAVLGEVEANHEIVARSTIITGQAESPGVQLSDLLRRARLILIELDKLVSNSVKLGRNNERIFRRGLWLRKKNSCITMLQDLRNLKQNIVLVMASHTA